MTTHVYDHDSEIDIVHKINELELENWINHLNYVNTELSNLIYFYTVQREKNDDANVVVLKKFEILHIDNNVILKSLSSHSFTRKNVVECDSTACDMSFINEHETYRRLYLYHIEKYRKQKDLFFKEIKDKVLC